MTETYALAIHIDSYEYSGSYYLLGTDYDTPEAVLGNVAADHILAMSPGGPGLCQHALNLLESGETVPEGKYEAAEVATRCAVYADPYYFHFSFSFDDCTHPIEFRRPGQADIEEVVANFDEYAHPENRFDRSGGTMDYGEEP
jgi:hypothetical protein